MTTKPTGAIALEDGTIFWGHGHGAAGVAAGEVCFNTAMTGYQEILTDPSYAAQIVPSPSRTSETSAPNDDQDRILRTRRRRTAHAARCSRPRRPCPNSWRAAATLDAWLKKRGVIGLSGIDTRALTRRIRDKGMPKSA
jgi:carbamoyl-phosphate synthase small subunit